MDKNNNKQFTAESLVAFFNLGNGSGFEKIIHFIDGTIGFNIEKPYPSDIPFKPPTLKDGTPDTVAIIRVI